MEIIPAILEPDFAGVAAQWQRYAGTFAAVHIDVADGQLVENKTWNEPSQLAALSGIAAIDVHLMVADPLAHLPAWLEEPRLRAVIFHVEARGSEVAVAAAIRAAGKEAIVAINPDTDVSRLADVLPVVDGVQIMTVVPGAMGAPFRPDALEKIPYVAARVPDGVLCLDGAMNPKNLRAAAPYRVSRVYVGSYFKEAFDVAAALRRIST